MARVHDGHAAEGPLGGVHGVALRGDAWQPLPGEAWEEVPGGRYDALRLGFVLVAAAVAVASRLFPLMAPLDVRLQVLLGEIAAPAAGNAVATSAERAHEHAAQRCAFDPLHGVATPAWVGGGVRH